MITALVETGLAKIDAAGKFSDYNKINVSGVFFMPELQAYSLSTAWSPSGSRT